MENYVVDAKKQMNIKTMMTSSHEQSKLTSVVKIKNCSKDREEKFKKTREIAIMCALDFTPFSISQKPGFKLFCELNNININNLPTSRNVAETGLCDIYAFCLKEIKLILENGPTHMSFVMDCWTDNFKRRSYINYKVHFSRTSN